MIKNIDKAHRLYEQALAAAQGRRPDRKVVIDLLEEASKLGSGQAAWALGDWARRGVGGKRDPTRAVRYFGLAAKLGSPNGACDFAKALEIGYGIRKSERRAREAYLLSAMLGDGRGAYEYYRCLWHGIGGKQDRHLAEVVREHFKKISQFTERAKRSNSRVSQT